MNIFSNSALSASHPRFMIVENNINTLQIDTNLEQLQQEEEQYQNQLEVVSDEGSATIEFEVLSDEFAIDSNDECSNSVSPILPSNKKPAQWSRGTIHYLIGTYKRLARDETSGKTHFGTTAIWTEVSRKFMQRGLTYTPEQCRTKWSLLKKLYQHIRNETQLQKFEFIEAIHEYYRNPKIERLLEEARKNIVVLPQRQSQRTRSISKPSIVKTEVKKFNIDNFKNKFVADECETTSLLCPKNVFPHRNTFDESEETEGGGFQEETFKLEIETDTCDEQEPAVCHEEHKTLNENQEEKASAHNMTSVDQHSHFIEEFKKIIESQEQRRNERHQEKLRIFRDYNERLLAQQEAAIILHKQIMERLIANL